MNTDIWSRNEAEAWNLSVPRRQTTREITFLTWTFQRFAKRRIDRILDLACGTGRLAIELASRGYQVTGIDKFSAPLSLARENASKRNVNVNFLRSSLQELRLEGRFDAAYCIQALYYILNERDLSSFLTKLHSLIRPGGVLIIDTGNFISMFGSYERVRRMNRRGKNWWIKRTIRHEIDDVNMLFYHKESTKMNSNGKVRSWKETHLLRMWSFPELRGQLIDRGFRNIHLFGQQKAKSKEATSHAPRLVIVANRS